MSRSTEAKKTWLFVGFVVAIIALAVINRLRSAPSPAEEAAAGQLGWLTDFDAAKEQAREKHDFLLINFTGSDWCPPCMRLRKQVFAQPAFADYAQENLVLLEADFPRRKQLSAEQQSANDSLARTYQIDSFPTIVVLDPQGKEVGRFGYTPGGADAFIQRIEGLRDRG